MAWEKSASPEVLAARDYAKKFDREQVIILSIGNDMKIRTVSYGSSAYMCNVAKEHGDIVHEALLNYYDEK